MRNEEGLLYLHLRAEWLDTLLQFHEPKKFKCSSSINSPKTKDKIYKTDTFEFHKYQGFYVSILPTSTILVLNPPVLSKPKSYFNWMENFSYNKKYIYFIVSINWLVCHVKEDKWVS